RNLVDGFEGFLRGKGYLIHDRDPLYTAKFLEILNHEGVKSVRLPARSPNLNAYAERFVLSIKTECLNRLIIVGEKHLCWVIGQYMEHYHQERPHQGMGNRLLTEWPESGSGAVTCQKRLGGLLNSYIREVA
ncbi:MAG: integrase core domain-containing protein, partial [Planctomycetota bacterium]